MKNLISLILISGLFLTGMIVSCSSSVKSSDDTSPKDSALSSDSSKSIKKSETLTLALTGDMMMGTDFPETPPGAYLPSDSGKHIMKDFEKITRRVDIAAGNLEGALGRAGKPKKCYNPSLCFTFRMPAYFKYRLKEAGFDYMNMANNHMGDFGKEGLLNGLKELESVDIAGGGIKGERPYAILERNGLKVGFCGFSTNDFCPKVTNTKELKEILAEMRPKCDIIVVSMHAGAEGSAYTHVPRKDEIFHGWPRGNVYDFAHTAIDNGADVVWGHGPHVLRGAEVYNDRLILYSLGNFCTPYRMGLSGSTAQAALAEVKVDSEGKFLDGTIHSYIQKRGAGPLIDSNHASARQIKKLSEEDFPESPLRISSEGALTKDRSSFQPRSKTD